MGRASSRRGALLLPQRGYRLGSAFEGCWGTQVLGRVEMTFLWPAVISYPKIKNQTSKSQPCKMELESKMNPRTRPHALCGCF